MGTACSGTDLVIGLLRELEAWWAPHGLRTRFKHAFSCDTKSAARDFILACWQPEALSECMGSGGSPGVVFLQSVPENLQAAQSDVRCSFDCRGVVRVAYNTLCL